MTRYAIAPVLSLLFLVTPAVAVAQEPPHDNPDRSPMAKDGYPLAGFHNGLFYLRDPHDNFRLFPMARLHIDSYAYAGPGVGDTPLKPTFIFRRFRLELGGEFFKDWVFQAQADMGQTGIDNAAGTNEIRAANPGIDPTSTNGRYASAQTVRIGAQLADAYLGWRGPDGLINFKLGQYNAPFMLENHTSNKAIPYLERSLAVRTVGIPTNKEIGLMGWGELKNKLLYYSAAVVNGEGQNRLNLDSSIDLMARVFARPLVLSKKSPIKDAQIGFSVRYGYRQQKWIQYDYPQMSTPGTWVFWSPIYRSSAGFTHILPSGDQVALAAELRIPYKNFDLTSEGVYINNHTREAIEGFQATNTERLGAMTGGAFYVQLGAWIGKRDIPGPVGYQTPPHLDFSKPDPESPPQALQLLARYELVNLTYKGASRQGALEPVNADGDIVVHSLQLGANYWMTKHLRFSFNYGMYLFPDSAPISATMPGGPVQTFKQRAVAPANTLATGVDNNARDGGHDLHEFSLRVGFQF